MQKINTFQELKELKLGEKVYIIENGNKKVYYFIQVNPKDENSIILINSLSYLEARCIHQSAFGWFDIFIGEYDSNIIGEAMIKQLEDKIKSIKTHYITKKL